MATVIYVAHKPPRAPGGPSGFPALHFPFRGRTCAGEDQQMHRKSLHQQVGQSLLHCTVDIDGGGVGHPSTCCL